MEIFVVHLCCSNAMGGAEMSEGGLLLENVPGNDTLRVSQMTHAQGLRNSSEHHKSEIQICQPEDPSLAQCISSSLSVDIEF